MEFQTQIKIILYAITVSASCSVFASGYEKTVLWSGKYSGVAGITASNISGAEALAFNPAGILTDKTGQELTANLSAVSSQFKGPIASNNVQETGQTTITTPLAMIYSATLNDQWAFAIGGYVGGGAKAEYNDIVYPLGNGSNNPITPTIKTDLSIVEASLGVAYRPISKLRIGAAWRVAFARANFQAAFETPPTSSNGQIANAELSNLKDTQYGGFRVGAQWVEDSWALGLALRSQMNFSASGDAQGKVGLGTGTVLPLTSPGATVSTTLPMAIEFGGHWDVAPKSWRAYAQYDFTQYTKVDAVGISGPYTVNNATSDFSGIPFKMNWRDQHVIRLAGEYLGAAMPVRFGYAYTTQVTASDYGRAPFTPPGPAHTITLGTGRAFFGGRMRADAGGDYTFASGTGTAQSVASDPTVVRAGDYAVNALSVHLGASYTF